MPAQRRLRSICRAFTAVAAFFATTAVAPTEAAAQQRDGTGFLNLGVGPTIYFDQGDPRFNRFVPYFGQQTQVHLELQAGLFVSNHVAITFNPTFAFGGHHTFITLPLGVEYDFAIRKVPGLYIYPRLNLGGAIDSGSGVTEGYFTIIPELGIKYVINHVANFGIEPISFPVYVGDWSGAAYRFTFFGGIVF